MRARWLLVAGVAALALRGHSRPELRIATFNIEDFPKNAAQVAGAADEIARLHAELVAVQEIIEPEVLVAAVRARLGPTWSMVDDGTISHRIGLLYDRARWTLVSRTVHPDTELGGRNKPVLEVRLADRDGAIVRALVVHLKSGTPGRPIRERQYAALEPIVRAARASGERVVVLGDFNATEEGDRADLARVAADARLAWATEGLACTAFWDRDDGCPRSRLDHALVWTRPRAVEVAGACATAGCEWEDRCPLYAEQVSDHCPVVITLDR